MTPFLKYQSSNRMGNALGEAMQEILDDQGVSIIDQQGVLPALVHPGSQAGACPDSDYTPAQLDRLQSALEAEYGSRGGQGLSVRIGRASFKFLLGAFGAEKGLTEPAFRLLPLKEKMEKGGEVLAGLFNSYTDLRILQEQDDDYMYWHIQQEPQGSEFPTGAAPRCHLPLGMLQEALYWVSAGKVFEVEQKLGGSNSRPACTLLVRRTPLG